MNERIRELAEQAGAATILFNKEGHYYIIKPELQKFAELIIKECLDVMDTTSKKALEQFTYMGDDVPTFHHQFEIKKHFGIK